MRAGPLLGKGTMRNQGLAAAAVILCQAAFGAATIPGDAAQGARIFSEQNCVTCHRVNGQGGTSAPDLGKRTGRAYTPAEMAGLMWNHAPAMWTAIEQAGIARPKLTSDRAADLFAFFYAARYFEQRGDAGRGRQLFAAKGCNGCHAADGASSKGPAVSGWQSILDPIEFATHLWNHGAAMRKAMAAQKVSWPALSGQDLTDMAVYVQNLPAMKGKPAHFSPGSAETGERLFTLKGCVACHKSAQTLAAKSQARTLADFGAAMWRHRMPTRQELNREEMRRLVGYLWASRYFEPEGNAARGAKVFAAKQCGNCHGAASSSAPKLGGSAFNSFKMVAELWSHGPAMLAEMNGKKLPWPRFASGEMADLIAHLNTLK